MKKGAARLKSILFFLLPGFILLSTASGYLYQQNKNYQYENRKLIILNDSILSENIELKNELQVKTVSAAIRSTSEKFKTNNNK